MYRYKARVLKVVDGDTIDLEINLGFKLKTSQRCRLNGIDTPESRTSNKLEKEYGLAIKKYLINKLASKTVFVDTLKQGKFGRYLVEVWEVNEDGSLNGRSVNRELIDKKYALEYHGGKKIEFAEEKFEIAKIPVVKKEIDTSKGPSDFPINKGPGDFPPAPKVT